MMNVPSFHPATRLYRAVLPALVWAVVVVAAPAFAQAPAQPQPPSQAQPSVTPVTPAQVQTPAASTAEIEALAQTLRDDAARNRFLSDLDTLIKLRRAELATPAATAVLGDRISHAVAERIGALATRMTAVLSVLRDVPRLVPWAESQVMDAAKRDRLVGLIWRFIVIVGLGMAAQFVFRKLTDGARRRLETVADDEAMLARGLRFTGRAVMLYLNALAYAGGAYGAYVALQMPGTIGAVLLVGASSFFAAKLVLATVRVFLSPGVAGLRLGDMGDETAQYLYIWARRLVRIFVYAFFLLEAMRLVGLPALAHESILYLLGLVFAGFLVVFVLQNRLNFGAVIRGHMGPGVKGRMAGGARARLAAVWHIAAIVYIIAVYLVWLFKLPGGFEFLVVATGWTALIVVLARVIVLIADRGLDRVMHIGSDLESRLPGLKARANRYMSVLRALVRWVTGLAAVILVLDVWGLDTLGWLASPAGIALIEESVTIVVILLIALAFWESINLAIARYIERLDGAGASSARVRTLLPLLRTTVLVVLVVLVGLIVLSELGINIGPLLAGAGVLGLAIGFGSQKLVQDVITGLFILVEDTLAVGDVVRFDATHAGVVEALSIRTVKLRDLSGTVHTLPFSEVKTVLNMTKGFAYYVSDVGVAYRENVDDVIVLLRDIAAEMQKDTEVGVFIVEPLEVLGLDKFGDSAVVIKVRLKVVPPIKQWAVGREFNRRIKARFDAEGIEIPFPHQTIYFGEDRAGKAPPVHVAMDSPEKA